MEKKMRKILIALLAVLLVSGALSAKVAVKLATLAPEGSAWYDTIKNMGDEWKKATNGEVTIRIYPGGVAGDETDVVRKMRVGQLQAAAMTSVGMGDIIPEIQALQMPMMIQSYEELDYIMDKIKPKLEARLEEKGFKVLNWGDVGWVKFFAQKPVKVPEDLKGQAMFVWGGDTNIVAAWKDAGFKVVPLAPTDIMTSLQTKMINAFSTTPLAAASFQWFGLAKNMTDIKWACLMGGTLIEKKTWEKIPAEKRDELDKIAKKSGQKQKKEIRELENKATEIMVKNGLNIVTLTAEDNRIWTEKAKGAYPRLLNSPELKAMYEEVKGYHEEYLKTNK